MDTIDTDLMQIVTAALDTKAPVTSALNSLCRAIRRVTRSSAVALWEVSPGGDLSAPLPDDRLFVLASDSEDQNPLRIHDLSLINSHTGDAIRSQQPLLDNDISKTERDENTRKQMGSLKAMISVPFDHYDGGKAAVSIYRSDSSPYGDDDRQRMIRIGQLIPSLYRAIRDRMKAELVEVVDEILDGAEVRSKGRLLTLDDKSLILDNVCLALGARLKCKEVSIYLYVCSEISLYLSDQSREVVRHSLIATTIEREKLKKVYESGQNDGLTGWVIDNRQPAWIFDLDHYEEDRTWIDRVYPGMNWNGDVAIFDQFRNRTGLSREDVSEHVSILAVPILLGQRALGVIRCTLTRNGHFFSRRDQELLKSIAAQISQCWAAWLSRRQMERENRSWTELAKAMIELNEFVQRELDQEFPSEKRIHESAVTKIEKVIPQAKLNTIRLVTPDKKQICIAAIAGSRRGEEERRKAEAYRDTIRLEPPNSAAAHVLRTGKAYTIEDVRKDAYHAEIFPGVIPKCIGPIKDHLSTLGVVDLRGFTPEPFPKQTEMVVELLGRQLGLYHRLVETIGELRKDRRAIVQVLADVSHQLKGPINQAMRRTERALQGYENEARLHPFGRPARIPEREFRVHPLDELRAARGLCRKARRVVTTLNIFSDLARERPIRLRRYPLAYDIVNKMLVESARDTELLLDPRDSIQFVVESGTFQNLPFRQVEADFDLLQQSAACLLDNAGKYSAPQTRVTVTGGIQDVGPLSFCYISVRNVGLPLRGDAVELCKRREWRSPEARLVTQEGSGIGLWLVDHIMKAHDGDLIITPTTPEGETDVRLLLPIEPMEVS